MKSSRAIEALAQGLSVATFMVMCWVVHRSLQVRTQCVNSSFLSFVQIEGERIENCRYESRLSLQQLVHPLTSDQLRIARSLEVLEPLTDLFPTNKPRLAVDVSLKDPRIFELGRGFVRIGREWLDDSLQTKRALVMGVLRREQPENFASDFQLETMTDFLLMSFLSEHKWSDHNVLSEVKFPTSAPSFTAYCKSPFRSLAHSATCASSAPDSMDLQANVWGLRPLFAVALWKVFDQVSLKDKLQVLATIRSGEMAPTLASLHGDSLEEISVWFTKALRQQLNAFKIASGDGEDLAVKRTLKELEVEGTTHWELTVDITQTPAWKEILQQFKAWSHYHQQQRVLVFTPEGSVAFPSGLPVEWGAKEIQSQKHVLIACHWPKAEEVVSINARHVFAKQSCGKVEEVFWN